MNAMIVSLNSAAEIWWQRTVSVSWQAAIVGLLLLALVWFGRRWSSQVHYALLLVALIKFAVPPLWSSPTGLLSQIGPVHQNAPETMASEFKRPNSGRRPPISAELDRRPEMATESVQTESQHVEADTELSPRDFQRPKTVIKNQRPMEPSQSATSPSTIVAVDIPRTLEKTNMACNFNDVTFGGDDYSRCIGDSAIAIAAANGLEFVPGGSNGQSALPEIAAGDRISSPSPRIAKRRGRFTDHVRHTAANDSIARRHKGAFAR
jgi:hypothetical protein